MEILRNFAANILDETELLAPGRTGLASLEIANAILLSALEQRTVILPLDREKYALRLTTLIQNSHAGSSSVAGTSDLML